MFKNPNIYLIEQVGKMLIRMQVKEEHVINQVAMN
jgi:hypothetical protein